MAATDSAAGHAVPSTRSLIERFRSAEPRPREERARATPDAEMWYLRRDPSRPGSLDASRARASVSVSPPRAAGDSQSWDASISPDGPSMEASPWRARGRCVWPLETVNSVALFRLGVVGPLDPPPTL